jgi:hypothetical protein
VVWQRPAEKTVVLPAGGPSDAEVQQLLRRLAEERKQLEHQLAEAEQMQTVVAQLSERVRRCEENDKHVQPPRPPQPTPVPPKQTANCDEVSCVLTNYEGPCCARLRGTRPPPSTQGLPTSPDRKSIENGLDAVKLEVTACRQLHSTAKGVVRVRVQGAADGSATDVAVAATPDPGLGTCVQTAVKKARFAPSQRGGSFLYPYVF